MCDPSNRPPALEAESRGNAERRLALRPFVRFETELAIALTSLKRKIAGAMADGATPIHKFALFDPDRLREIIGAFDDACYTLPQPVSEETRGILAKHITENAQRGQWSRERLRDEALAHLMAVKNRAS
jgi:hypothetical protein